MTQSTIERPTTRKAKSPAQPLHLIARSTFKASGMSLYRIQSTTIYQTTLNEGRATGCINEQTGESCLGFKFTGHCKHAQFAMSYTATHDTLVHTHLKALVAIELAKPATRTEIADWHAALDATNAARELAEREYQERKKARALASSNAYNPWALNEILYLG